MKKLLLGTALSLVIVAGASAADLYTKAPPTWSWTGFYVGAHVGGDWGNVSVLDNILDGVPPGPFTYTASGIFGGGTAGYNLQFQNIVVGVEGDLGFMDLSGAGLAPSSDPLARQDLTLKHGGYGDITGRLGVASGGTLFYAKGGWAFYAGHAQQQTSKDGYVPTATSTFTGWTAGAGLEHFITPKLSLKAEYLHFGFGTQAGFQTNVADPGSPIGYQFRNWTTLNAESVKAGINYHF
jgi:outer membrane immunogenic protein